MSSTRQPPTELAIAHQGSAYSNAQRREAALLYAIHGCGARVALDTGIPESTLSDWRRQPWWETLLAEVRSEKDDELDARMSETIDLAMGKLKDRIINGDEVMTKEGKGRVGMRGRDLAIATAVIFDKRALIRRQPTSIKGSSQAEDIAAQLTAWMRSQKERLVGQGSTEENSNRS